MNTLALRLTPLALALAGCAAFEYSDKKPVIQRVATSKEGTDMVAVRAERRIVFSQSVDSKRRVCSEPPPDVAEAFADSIRASLSYAADRQAAAATKASAPSRPASGAADGQATTDESTDAQAKASADISVARDFATAISQIYTRSQAVQMFRDGTFMLCQAHLNSALAGDVTEQAARDQAIKILRFGRTAADQPSESEIKLLADAIRQNAEGRNYSVQFERLLNATTTVLITELPHLYRVDVKNAEEAAKASAAEAKLAAVKVAAAASAAGVAEDRAQQAATDSRTARIAAETASQKAAKSAKDAAASADQAASAAGAGKQ